MPTEDSTIKVGMICEAGGPFKQLQLIEQGLTEFERFYVTYRTDSTEDVDGYLITKQYQKVAAGLVEPRLNVEKLLALVYLPLALLGCFTILVIERPDVIISTGDLTIAGPFFVVAKLLGIRTVFIESIGQFEGPSTAGRVLQPLTDRLLVQNEETLETHAEKAEYYGGIF
jgi:UDP-N-acetylglucosamine:LPS N-acetylglucosamine transferase